MVGERCPITANDVSAERHFIESSVLPMAHCLYWPASPRQTLAILTFQCIFRRELEIPSKWETNLGIDSGLLNVS